MRRNLTIPDKKELEDYYNQFGITMSDVARKYGTTNPTVRSWLKKLDIPIKDHKTACREKIQLERVKKPHKTEFEKFYNELSLKDLQIMYGIGQETVYKWLDDFNIEKRELSESIKISKNKRRKLLTPSKKDLESYINSDSYCGLFDCAANFGISASFLRTVIKDYAIKLPIIYRSSEEKAIFDYCCGLNPNWLSNDKSFINPFEIDMINHELKLCIEYGGLYWHGENFSGKSRDYHQKKYILCKERGYRLITLFSSDNLEKVKRFLLYKHNIKHTKSIYARNCVVEEITGKQAKDFHDQYHMNSGVQSSINYALIHKDEIVSVASFAKPRFNTHYDLECTRFTVNAPIAGGASKLFSMIKNKSIITYADLRFGDGKSYENCGFEYLKTTDPNYFYFKPSEGKLYSRIQFQKHKLKDKLEYFDNNLTEWQNMVNNGWDRIWDCGSAVYIKKGNRSSPN